MRVICGGFSYKNYFIDRLDSNGIIPYLANWKNLSLHKSINLIENHLKYEIVQIVKLNEKLERKKKIGKSNAIKENQQ